MRADLQFEHEIVDRTPFVHSWGGEGEGYDAWGGVAAADFDGDGRDEYVTGGRRAPEGGYYHLYDRTADGEWTRHELIDRGDFRPGVGAAATDLDGDGRPELVVGEWGSRLFALRADPTGDDVGEHRTVFDGFEEGPHDVLAADLDGDGSDEVVARVKDHRLVVFHDPSLDGEWEPQVLATDLAGDGTAVANLSDGPGLDVVTNRGWFENVDGDGSEWRRRPLLADALEWDHETRVAVGDVDGDGDSEVVVTESELGAEARLAVLSRPADDGDPWDADLVFPAAADRRGLHTLVIADLDGDGENEVFTGEMENGKTDGVESRPRWWCLGYADGAWEKRVLLDENLGTHCARVLDVDGDGRPDLVGKVWRANDPNGADARNHVDCLLNRTPRD
jgi:hypothetical protein